MAKYAVDYRLFLCLPQQLVTS